MYRHFIKPAADILVAFIALVILFPIWVLVMLLLLFANQGKPFFIQPRPGKNGRIFKVIKFKTMNDRKDSSGQLLPDEERLTPIGNFVRKTSLDEVPQLFNVLKGDMSFVGPRPLLVEYMPLYNARQARRHEVKPGITGWAQVNGRNTVAWPERFEMDAWYVDHQSFQLDISILFMTILKVFKSEGISSGTSATMEKFKGDSSPADTSSLPAGQAGPNDTRT